MIIAKKGNNFSKGLEGVIAVESSISHIDGLKGKLVYRGYNIYDLAAHSSFEEVIYLLWFGHLPNKKELNQFNKLLRESMKIPSPVKKFIQSLPRKNTPISSLRSALSVLAAYDKEQEDISIDATKRKALRIMGIMPSLVAAIHRHAQEKSIVSPKSGMSFAGNFLSMLHGKKVSKEEEQIMNVCLILHAEHGLNASTFASRVTVATLSDIHSGIVSAIGTLKGPLHGGANKRAIQFLHHMGDDLHVGNACVGSCLDHVDKYVERLLAKKSRIMGIGHRVYKVKDPRAKILESYAKEAKKDKKYFQMAKEVEKVMAEEKKLYPNVDFFSGVVYEEMNIPTNLYVCLFALSRTAGWLAHSMEQYQNNRLIRPRAAYTGKLSQRYVPLSQRK